MVKNTIPKIRPRYEYQIKYSKEFALKTMATKLEKTDKPIKGVIVDNHVILDVPKQNRHLWSPQMNFRITNDDNNQQLIQVIGIIGPRPEVWTFFLFLNWYYGVFTFIIWSFKMDAG